MTRKKRRRSGYRQPTSQTSGPASEKKATARAAKDSSDRPKGLLSGFLGSPVPASMSTMPYFRTSLARGFLLVGSTPILVILPFLWVFVTWLALVALGFIGSPAVLAGALALPPLSVSADFQNSVILFGQAKVLYVMLPMLLLRSVFTSVLVGLIVEGFERGAVSLEGVRRGIGAALLMFGLLMLGLFALLASQFGALLGPGLGTLLAVLLPTAALWILGFAPFGAVTERRNLLVTVQRSYYGARTPGGRQFLFSLTYLLLFSVLQFFVPGGGNVTANPGIETWVFLLVLTYFHVGALASFGYRWLAIAPTVSEPVPASRRDR